MGSGNIVLGLSGSIAAYKSAALAGELVKRGYAVRAVLTPGATRFITPLTLEALTGHPAGVEVWEEQPDVSRVGHLELARWADILAVAPASAGTIARLALGLADDLLAAVALACPAPLLVAPAMESAMYRHPATQAHLETLRQRGCVVVGPETGRLASGAIGEGRMSEPIDIADIIDRLLITERDLLGKRVLITAGPTFEAIDPVRYIGNRSSGKMGYALAEEAQARGADVLLISGPTALSALGIPIRQVESTDQMYRAVMESAPEMDVVVMCAAVADFRPVEVATEKHKRTGKLTIDLEPTPDIAAAAAAAAPNAIHVGFALETQDLLASAREKMQRKGQDMVVANSLSALHNPFGSERNQVTLVFRDKTLALPEMPKREVAKAVWDEVVTLLERRDGASAPHPRPLSLKAIHYPQVRQGVKDDGE